MFLDQFFEGAPVIWTEKDVKNISEDIWNNTIGFLVTAPGAMGLGGKAIIVSQMPGRDDFDLCGIDFLKVSENGSYKLGMTKAYGYIKSKLDLPDTLLSGFLESPDDNVLVPYGDFVYSVAGPGWVLAYRKDIEKGVLELLHMNLAANILNFAVTCSRANKNRNAK